MPARRRAVTLLLVITSLALAAALIAPLALLSGSAALGAAQRAAALQHKLAGDSLLALLPQRLQRSDVRRELAQGVAVRISLHIDDIAVDALLQDDSAKLPSGLLAGAGGNEAIRELSAARGLAPLPVNPTAHATGCLEDAFGSSSDAALYGTPEQPGWVQVLTPLAGPVHVRGASDAVLSALFADVDSRLGSKIAQQRRRSRFETVEELVLPLELPDAQRRVALERLTTSSKRFSLLIRSELEGAVRERYVIVQDEEPPLVVVDWEVAP